MTAGNVTGTIDITGTAGDVTTTDLGTLYAGGNITVVSGDDARFAASIETVNDAVVITAGGDVVTGGNATITGIDTDGVGTAGTSTITADGSVTLGADVTVADGVMVTADENITLDGNITADADAGDDGDATLTADADSSGSGSVTMVAAAAITAEDITVTGYDIQLDRLIADWAGTVAGGAVMSGNGTITVRAQNNAQLDDTLTAGTDATSNIDIDADEGVASQTAGDMTAGGIVSIDGAQGVELDGTIGTATAIGIDVVLTSAAGTIDVGGAITADGNITGTAEESIEVAAVVLRADADADDVGDISLTADSNLDADGRINLVDGSTLAAENISLTAFDIIADVLTANISGIPGDGTIIANAANNATLNDTLTAGTDSSSDIDIDGTDGTVRQTAGDMTAGGDVTIDAGVEITLLGTIGAGAAIGGSVLIGQSVTPDANVTLGGTVTAVHGITVSADGDIAANADLTSTGNATVTFDNISLDAGGDVTQLTNTNINAQDGGVQVTGDADVTLYDVTAAANNMDHDGDSINDSAISVSAGGTLDIARGPLAHANAGLVATAAGNLNIALGGDDIVIDNNVTASGDVTGSALNNLLVGDPDYPTPHNITVTADAVDNDGTGDVVLTADADSSGDGRLEMGTLTLATGENVILSGYNVVADQLTADLNADGAGNVVVSAANNATFNDAVTAGNVTGMIDITGTEGDVTTNDLGTLYAGGNITVTAGDDATFAASIETVNDAVVITAGGDVTTGGNATISAVDGLLGTGTNGTATITADGSVTLGADVTVGDGVTVTAAENIAVNGNITADVDLGNDGDAVLTADSDSSSSGDVTMGDNVITADNISVSGYNVQLDELMADWAGTLAAGAAQDGAGNVTVSAANDATFDDAVTAGNVTGIIDIDATEGDATTNVGATLDAGAEITVDAGLDITIGDDVLSRNSSVTMTARDNVDINANVTGNTNVGFTADLEDVTLDGNVTAVTGNVTVDAGSDVVQGTGFDIDAGAGVSVTSEQDVTLVDVAANANAFNGAAIMVNAGGNATINGAGVAGDEGLVATGAGNLNIDITANDASLQNVVTADGSIEVDAGDTIVVGTDNGAAVALTADSDNSGAGDVILRADTDGDNTGNVVMANTSLATGENITVSGENVVVDELTADRAQDDGAGDVTVTAANDLTVNDTITAGAGAGLGSIALTATDGSVTQAAQDEGATSNDMLAGGNVTIDAAEQVVLNGTIGNTTAAIGTDVLVGQQIAPELVQFNGTVDANGDIIVNATDIDVNARLTGDDDANGAGDILLDAANDVDVSAVVWLADGTAAGNGNVTINAVEDITFDANGDVTAAGTGSVSVNADSDGDDFGYLTMADGTVFTSGTGTMTATAGEDIQLGQLFTTNNTAAAVTIDSSAGAVLDAGDAASGVGSEDIVAGLPNAVVTITAVDGIGTGSLETPGDSIETNITTLVANNTGEGDINILETDTIVLQSVINANGHVTTVATSGTITATQVYAQDEGIYNGLENDANRIFLETWNQAGTGGDIYLTDVVADYDAAITTQGGGNVTIGDNGLVTNNDVDITIVQAGDIILGQWAITTTNNVTLIAQQGSILDGADTDVTNITAGGDLVMWVGNAIGEANAPADPLEVDVTGTLSVGAYDGAQYFPGRTLDYIWAFINGTSGDGSIYYLGTDDTPPGIIEWNMMSWGGPEEPLQRIERQEGTILRTLYEMLDEYDRHVWNFSLIYFPHVWAMLLELPDSMSIEFILEGEGKIEFYDEDGNLMEFGPDSADIGGLGDSLSYSSR